MRARGSNRQAVSSRASRTTASSNVSPCSTWPAGWLSTSLSLIRSSTTRKRPLSSVTAATVISGLCGMRASISALRASARRVSLTTAGGSEAVLGSAGVPDVIEFGEVELGDGLVVEVGDAVPGIGAHPEDDGLVVRDQVRGSTLGRFPGNVADVD